MTGEVSPDHILKGIKQEVKEPAWDLIDSAFRVAVWRPLKGEGRDGGIHVSTLMRSLTLRIFQIFTKRPLSCLLSPVLWAVVTVYSLK